MDRVGFFLGADASTREHTNCVDEQHRRESVIDFIQAALLRLWVFRTRSKRAESYCCNFVIGANGVNA